MAEHNNLQISQFLKVARSHVFKVRKELEDNDGQIFTVTKRKSTRNTLTALEYTLHKFI